MDNKFELNNKLYIGNKVFTKNRKEPKKTKIRVLCKHSINDKKLYFTNFLKRKDLKNTVNTQVFNIIKADGIEVSNEDIPIDFSKRMDFDNEEFLECNNDENRIPSILNNYGVKFEKETILKCYGKSRLGHEIAGKGIPDDTVRVFVKLDMNDDEWKVVLIDPYHLVATEKYKDNYNKHKDNKVDICELESLA